MISHRRKPILPPLTTMLVGSDMKGVGDLRKQHRKNRIPTSRGSLAEVKIHGAFIRGGMLRQMNGLEVSTVGTRWKLYRCG